MFHIITAAILAKAPPKTTKKLRLGPPSLSNAIPNMTDKQKLAWPLFLDNFLPKILKIKEPIMQWAQTIGWFSDFMKDFKPPRKSAKDLGIKPPGKTVFPTNIAPSAKKLWGEFWDKYKDKVINIPDIKTQWAAAVAIFRNYCLKRDVVPFNEVGASGPKVKTREAKDTSLYMNKRFNLAREKIKKKVQNIFKKFTVSVGRRVLKEKLSSITYNPKISQFEIESILPLKLQAGTRPIDLKQYLESVGFVKAKNGWNQDLGSHSITAKKAGDTLEVFLTIRFTKDHILNLLGLSGTTDDSTVIKKLSKRVKQAMTENTIMLSADFENEPVDKEDQETIDKSLENLSPNDAKMTYGLEYIRSLGDPIFQYHLVTALLDKYGDYEIWNNIKNSPNKMLDNQLVTNLEDVETENPEYGM